MCNHKLLLRRLQLPRNLLELIHSGKLQQAVDDAYAQIDAINAGLDAWEEKYPEAAAVTPWLESRQQWKKDGRPRCQWWEALLVVEKESSRPIGANDITCHLLDTSKLLWMKRQRNDPEKCAEFRKKQAIAWRHGAKKRKTRN